jgi:hypothetical protein
MLSSPNVPLANYLVVPCPNCGAKAGQYCKGPLEEQMICSGHPIGTICGHRVRDYLVGFVNGTLAS